MTTTLVEEGENFLAHHGILGMKWGRRKPESQSEESSKGSTKSRRPISKKKVVGGIIAAAVSSRILYVAGKEVAAPLIENKYAHKFGTPEDIANIKIHMGGSKDTNDYNFYGHGYRHAKAGGEPVDFNRFTSYMPKSFKSNFNKGYEAAQRESKGEDLIKALNPSSIRMVQKSGVWSFIKLGEDVVEHE